MTQNSNPGNFGNDRAKASEAGRAGGQHGSGDAKGDVKGNTQNETTKAEQTGQKGSHGAGNFADDRDRASAAGRKGGSK